MKANQLIKKSVTWLLTLFLLLPLSGNATILPAYEKLLQRHLAPGELDGVKLMLVDYPAIVRDENYQEALKQLAQFDPAQLQTREQKLAFYINAYNLLAIKVVLDHWPVASIRDAGNWLFPVWKKEAGIVAGETVTLHQIEHEILRPMGEPRIHMAIVCASVSCPDLRAEVYQAEKLDSQLNEQSRHFLANPKKGLYLQKGSAHVSKIFDWFEEDFIDYGGVKGFVSRYAPQPVNLPIEADIPYNWNLNSQNN